MKTSVFLGARYTSLIGATKKPEVRAISGFALAPLKKKFPENLSDFSCLRGF